MVVTSKLVHIVHMNMVTTWVVDSSTLTYLISSSEFHGELYTL